MLAELFSLFASLICLAAFGSFINARTLKLPSGVMLMLLGTVVSLGLIIVGKFSPAFTLHIRTQLGQIDFSEFLLGILLSFLIFAGSMHVHAQDLKDAARSIGVFAIFGTTISTFAVGLATYYLLPLFGIEIPLTLALLFGALISPTDPVTVVGILKKSSLPKRIQTNIVGESLFNDGIGVVIFAILLQVDRMGADQLSAWSVSKLLLQEAGGGLLCGAIIGYLGFFLMRRIDHFQTEILISLAMVMGGYVLCHAIHVSGPLAMVIAGIITGNKGRSMAMSDNTRDYLEKFWEVLDDILNTILFMLIGLEIIVVDFKLQFIWLGLIASAIVLIGRYLSLFIPVRALFWHREFGHTQLQIMTWGGLRGGISVALALSLPNNAFKDVLVGMTFVVVFFSVAVQGLTIERLIKAKSRHLGSEGKD